MTAMKKIIFLLVLFAGGIAYATTTNPTSATISVQPQTLTTASRTVNASASVDRRDSTIYVDGTSNTITLTIPATTRGRWPGRVLTIVDKTGTANARNITVTPTSSDINGAGSLAMNVAYQAVTIQCEYSTAGAAYHWYIVGAYLRP